MTTASLKSRIIDDMKAAMRNKEKDRLMTIRLVLAAIKQQEVDSRKELDDNDILLILDKLVKQRRDSITQYTDAGRDDLASREQMELELIQQYLPAQLTEDEIADLIDAAMKATGAAGMADMGKVMGYIKPKARGRADMGQVSGLIRARLS